MRFGFLRYSIGFHQADLLDTGKWGVPVHQDPVHGIGANHGK